MAEVLEEARRQEAFDAEMRANPHDPWARAAAFVDLGPGVIPWLVAALDDPARGPYAAHALAAFGAAARSAADALTRRAADDDAAAVALFAVDPARARHLGVHRRPGVWERIVARLEPDPTEAMAFLASLLDDPDPRVVAGALGARPGHDRTIRGLAARVPDDVPVARIRPLLEHPDPAVRAEAAAVLAWVRTPEDAGRVLRAALAGRISPVPALDWLAPEPESDRLVPGQVQAPAQVFDLLRRRRCAGLSTDPHRLRDTLRRLLRGPPAAAAYAARAAAEVGDTDLAPEIAARVREPGATGAMAAALAGLGRAGREALEAVGDRALAEAVAAGRVGPGRATRAAADAAYVAGHLDDPTHPDDAAWGLYANLLLTDPTDAHAAFRLAWIDRGFGVRISPARADWLRRLGVGEARLADLCRPVPPLPGFRFAYRRATGPDPARVAVRAERAELPSIAATFWEAAGDRAAAARCRREAEAQVDART